MRRGSCKALLISAAVAGTACLQARPALAHAGEPIAAHDLWTAWEFTPLVAAMLLALSLAYGIALSHLWRSAGVGRLVARWQVAAYYGGVATLAIALLSPVDPLGGMLFSAHMVQHVLLIMVAAPLLALGAPAYTWIWMLPLYLRRRLAHWWILRPYLRHTVRLLCLPIPIWLASALSLWVWHVPRLYEGRAGQ